MRHASHLLLLSLLVACTAPPPGWRPRDLALLRDWMSGSFSSRIQALADPEHYFPIELHMCPIWETREDGPWLYAEQATATQPERPYRQRVYRLRLVGDGRIASDVYLLPGDPLELAGAWRDPRELNALSPELLLPREGCTVFLSWREDASYAGATEGLGCASELAGAAYATSEVVISENQIRSWDRGFDAAGKQVWGAELGPYLFLKQPPSESNSPQAR